MYNRYVPQNDGSYRRNWIPDQPPEPPKPQKKPNPPKPQNPPEPPVPPCPPKLESEPDTTCEPKRPSQRPHSPPGGVAGFFRQLIPKDFCTEDLLIVLLLLLMSGDCKEDQNFALLTLGLYLFL